MRDHINAFAEVLGTLSSWNYDSAAGMATLQKLVLAQAEMVAYLNAFVFLVVVAFIAMPLVFLLRRPPEGGPR